ncbi:MAG TPA: DegQ family serine endoprotease [Micropepsaceae bacterium]|nr:DegQ family serine endoprotease [Micropepsaceae bacterium]
MRQDSFSRLGIARLSVAGLVSAIAVASFGLGVDAWSAPAVPTAPATKAAAVPIVPTKPAVAGPTVALSPSAAARPQGYADLAERLLPMVVNISTSQTLRRRPDPNEAQPAPQAPQGSPLDDFFKDFMDRGNRPRRVQSLGSGFIIDPAGYVVTNNHVIDGADEITVILNDTTSLPATLVGKDDKTDLALLKVNSKQPLAVAKFGDSDKSRVGDLVMAIGDPFGLGGTVTTGIVSARNRDINSGSYDDFIQTDAPINRGNSGGPLFNMDGEVIGVNSAIYSPTGGSVGIGFAIPANQTKNVIAQLKATGKIQRGWLGVRIQQVSDEIAETMGLDRPRGALIAGMTDGGPAAKAGVLNGDVVLSFDGKPVGDNRALPRMVAEAPIGKTVNIEILRKGQRKTMPITVQRLVEDEKVASVDNKTPAKPGAPKPPVTVNLGMSLAPVSPDSRRRFRLDPKVQGVVVTEVDADSPAGQKNIRPGDVITEVAQQKVISPEEVSAKLDAERKAGHKVVLLQVSRGGELTFIGVRLP